MLEQHRPAAAATSAHLHRRAPTHTGAHARTPLCMHTCPCACAYARFPMTRRAVRTYGYVHAHITVRPSALLVRAEQVQSCIPAVAAMLMIERYQIWRHIAYNNFLGSCSPWLLGLHISLDDNMLAMAACWGWSYRMLWGTALLVMSHCSSATPSSWVHTTADPSVSVQLTSTGIEPVCSRCIAVMEPLWSRCRAGIDQHRAVIEPL